MLKRAWLNVAVLISFIFDNHFSGAASQSASALQEASIITTNSNPFSLTSSNTKSETPTTEESKSRVSKKLHRRGGGETMLSPGSASLPRRSPRQTVNPM